MGMIDFYGDGGGGYEPDIINDPGRLNPNYGATDPPARSASAFDPNSPDELARQNAIYGVNGTAMNRPSPTATWDAPHEAWSQPTAPSGGGGTQWILDALDAAQSTDDRNYWLNEWNSGRLGTDRNWVIDAINRGDGALAVRNGTMAKRGAGSVAPNAYAATGGNPGGYTDPSAQLYLSELLKRLQQVQQPQDNSIFDMLKALALQVTDKLKQPPYSAADEQALITKYREPLTQARDAAYQRNKEEASRKGYLPSSGLLRSLDSRVDQAYEGGIAQGANAMGVDAVKQKQANMLQALQVLSGLNTVNNQRVDRGNAMSDQAVSLAKMFPDFDAQRLDQLLRASGDSSSSSALSSLMSLANLNLNSIGMNNANDQANSAAWGKLLAVILGGL